MFSFAPADGFIGTYGVGPNNPSKIELTINEDHSFSYQDYSNPSKEIDVSGTWEIQSGKIVLMNYYSLFSIHDKWKIEEHGMIAKSRKGMTFYTLHKMD